MGYNATKQDINILTSGLWILMEQTKRNTQDVCLFEKEIFRGKGKVKFKAFSGLPGWQEARILDYILLKAQKNWEKSVQIPIKEIRENVFSNSRKSIFFRTLLLTLEKYKNLTISFDRSFKGEIPHPDYQGKRWRIVEIGVIDHYGVSESVAGRGKKTIISVKFNEVFLSLLKNSEHFKLIPVSNLKGISLALHRWIYKWKDSRKNEMVQWIGNIDKLLEWYRSELNSYAFPKYKSVFLRDFKKAISRFNSVSDFEVELKEENGIYFFLIKEKRKKPVFDVLPSFLKEFLIKKITEELEPEEPIGYLRTLEPDDILKEINDFLFVKLSEEEYRNKEKDIFYISNFVHQEKGMVYIVFKSKYENPIKYLMPNANIRKMEEAIWQ